MEGRGREGRVKAREGEGREGGLCSSNISFKNPCCMGWNARVKETVGNTKRTGKRRVMETVGNSLCRK